MQSKAATVTEYLAELPPDRRAAIEAVRRVILDNVDQDIEEGMYYGMITYYVPHRIFPAGYHCDPRIPLPYLALASQKQYMTLYVMTEYGEGGSDPWLRNEWARAGKKLDMGKCCIRFKKLDDLPLDVVGGAIRRVPSAAYIARYEHQREGMGLGSASPRGKTGRPDKGASGPHRKPTKAPGKAKASGRTNATGRAKAARTAKAGGNVKVKTKPAAKASTSTAASSAARGKATAARAGHLNAAASRSGIGSTRKAGRSKSTRRG